MGLRLIAYTSDFWNDKVYLKNSEQDELLETDNREILEFLGEDYSDPAVPYRELKVAWNLDVFVSVILRNLGMKICKELTKPKHEVLFDLEGNLYDPAKKPDVLPEGIYDIFYIPSKIFGLQVGEHKSYFYHLEQYYDEEEPPTDCLGIYAKAYDLVDAFKQMNLNPYKLTSPVSVYESSVLNHLDLPTILDLPKDMPDEQTGEIIEWSEECLTRNWLEAFAVGHWKAGESYDFDIQSAHPFQLAQVKDFRKAKFAKSKNFCPDADDGIMMGKVTIYDGVKCSPILDNINGNIQSFVGTRENYKINLRDFQFIQKWGIGEFKLDYGYFWKYQYACLPLEVAMHKLFDLRHKQGMVKKLAKRCAAATWGKLVARNMDGSTNNHYNPIFAMQTTTGSRLQVAEFIYKHKLQDDIIHIGIDGFRTSRRVAVPKTVGLGCWRLDNCDAVIVLSPGRVFTESKKPQGLFYSDIINLVEAHPRETYYGKTLRRRQTLTEAVEAGDLSKLGTMRDFHSAVDLNLARTSQDRIFADFPKCGRDLLDKKFTSEPLRVSLPLVPVF